MKTPTTHLQEIGACSEARNWVAAGKFRSLEAAWKACDNPRWLLWYASRKAGPVGDPKRKVIVTVACEIARLVLPIWQKKYPDDKRVENCILTTEAWVRGEATIEKVREARSGVASADAAAAYAAYAAACAADSASAATTAASASAMSAADSAAAAFAFAAASALPDRNRIAEQALTIIRKHYPTLPT
jgi:hypothetical protein